MTEDPRPPDDLHDLAHLSARIGADPLLIQAAGGNTSVKDGQVMWIKASGTLLADAATRDIFVPVGLEAMRAALAGSAAVADRPARFTLAGHRLRPSIETSLHAVFPQRVVVHVHCVQTLAAAIRADAEAILEKRLAGFDWRLAPYVQPGATLAVAVAARLGPATDVVVLRNHGLIVAAESVASAEALLGRVTAALAVRPPKPATPDIAALGALAGPGWTVPEAGAAVHQLALDPARVRQATGGSLYPDHVVFCGVGARALDGAAVPEAATAPPMLIVPGKGVLMRADASSGARAMARCLADVLMRVPPGAALCYLTPAQNAALLDWDAEKYRQSLNA